MRREVRSERGEPMAQVEASALELVDVSRSYGTLGVIDCLDLVVRRGEFLAIIGPSGCGKTTLLNLLSGFDLPTAGAVRRHGQARMIYQEGGLLPWKTGAENILMGLPQSVPQAERYGRVRELLELVGMESFSGSYPHQLSGGMRQRVELARALAGDAETLLMDEPFSALDYITRLRMRQELARILRERPRTVVFVTHDVEEAAQLATRVLVLTPRPARIALEVALDYDHRPRSLTEPLVVRTVERLLHGLGLDEPDSAES